MVTSWVHEAPNIAVHQGSDIEVSFSKTQATKNFNQYKQRGNMLKIICLTFFSLSKLLFFQYMNVYVKFTCGNRCERFSKK